jgi:hypothetical protein
MYKFLAAFGMEKVHSAVTDVVTWLTAVDPKTATAAQLGMLRQKRDEYAGRLVEARRALAKDQAETAAIQAKVDAAKKALGILQGRLATAEEAEKADIMGKAKTIATQLETNLAELEREKKEDAQAQEVVDAVQKLYDQMDGMLREAHSTLEDAARRKATAEADRDHAKLMSELKGSEANFSGLNVALDAMNRAADEAEKEAEVLAMASASDARTTESESVVDEVIKSEQPADSTDPFRFLK